MKRFDLAANSISTAYTLPGPVIIEGIPLAGSWDLSADGSQLVDAFGNPLTVHCPQSACYTYFQDSAGTIAPIFPSHQSPLASLIPQPMISPDGTMAVAVVSAISGDGSPQYSLVQQALPAGEEITSAILPVPQAASPTVLGWTTGDAILLSQPSLEADGPTRVLVGASGSSDAAKLVETIQVTSQSGQIIFAPISLR